MENVFILIFVTFLLGMAATCASKIHFGMAEKTAQSPSGSKTEIFHALRATFIEPYTLAWKRLAPAKCMLQSTFDLNIHTLHTPMALSSRVRCLTPPCFP